MKNFLTRLSFFALLLLLVGLAACFASGPQKTLNVMAEALKKRDSSSFLACIDMHKFALNEVKNMTRDNQLLNSLDSLTRGMGLEGGMLGGLLSGVLQVESRVQQQYMQGVSSGELEKQCRAAQTPDCPWSSEALKNAQVKELNESAAVAAVTTQARATTWLALRKKGEQWLVTGLAMREDIAKEYALDNSGTSESGLPFAHPAPDKDEKDKSPSEGVTRI